MALVMALSTGFKPEIFNTDQGNRYTGVEITGILKKHGIRISMDGCGRALDNVFIERIWGKLKGEWLNHYGTFGNIEQVRLAVFEYIEGYYYNQRFHEGLGYRTPR